MILEGRLGDAIDILDMTGVHTEAAYARLRRAQLETGPWLDEAEAFYRKVGATRFLGEVAELRAGVIPRSAGTRRSRRRSRECRRRHRAIEALALKERCGDRGAGARLADRSLPASGGIEAHRARAGAAGGKGCSRAGDVAEVALARLADVDQLHVGGLEQPLELRHVDGGERLGRRSSST